MATDTLILCYHAVSDGWRSDLAVSTRRLESQLTQLLRRGYRGATFTDALTGPSTQRTLVVTFDDGYRSVLEHAAPILAALGVPGTLYVPTALIGARRRADWDGVDHWLGGVHADELSLLSWEEVAALAAQGWEIGSHGRTHARLPELDDDGLADELALSRRELGDRLGAECTSVAYPYGAVDRRVVVAALRAGYTTGAGLPARPHVPLAINWPRVGVYEKDRRPRFDLKVSPAARHLRALGGDPPDAVPGDELGATELRADSQLRDRTPAGGAGPRVSVIVPCFNDGDVIVDALNSIDEPEPLELVVVDDASTDPSTATVLDRLESAGVHVLRHDRNQGVSAARNTGMAHTSAPFVFPLDADDLAVSGAISMMLGRLEAEPAAVACFGNYREFGTRTRVATVPPRLDGYRVSYRNAYPVAALFRRTLLETIGGWRDPGAAVGYPGYEDWHLWMAIAERGGRGVHVGAGRIVTRRRLHGTRMLSQVAEHHARIYAILRRVHPGLFGRRRELRRATDLGRVTRVIYPLAFGWRPPLGVLTALHDMARRAQVWRAGQPDGAPEQEDSAA